VVTFSLETSAISRWPQVKMTTKALFFDVFGTCVDWRKTVTDTLFNSTKEALDASGSPIPDDVRSKASALV
jgi:hypothetical protein